jgi:hypothetical protein
MGFVDIGNQIKSFTFKQEATSPGFNKINVGTTKPGIYQGGKVFLRENLSDPIVNPQWIIKPMTLALESRDLQNREILINLITTSDVVLSAYAGGQYRPFNVTDEDYVIVARFDWLNVKNNYADFLIRQKSQIIDRDVVIARLIGQGTSFIAPGNPPVVSYDITTYGDSYDGLDERDLVNTNLGETGNNRIIRINGDYSRLKLRNHDPNLSNEVSPQSEIALPRTSGRLTMFEESNPENRIEATFHVNDENVKKDVSQKEANSSFYIRYTAGFPINTDPPMLNNYLNIYQDEFNRVRIRNSLGADKVFNIRIESNNYREIF